MHIRRPSFLLALGLVVCGTLSACSDGPHNLKSDVTSLSDTGAQLDVGDRTDEPWDAFLVVCPYQTETELQARLGAEVDGLPDLSRNDDQQAIVFLASGNIVAVDTSARTEVDLCSTGSWPVLPLEASTLALKPSTIDGNWVATPPWD
jgi:hypothetical protein